MIVNIKELLKAIYYSGKEATKWKIWKWFATGSIGALSGTLRFGEQFFQLELTRSVLFAFAVLFFLFIIRFMTIFIRESYNYFHEKIIDSVFGDTIILLKDSFANAHLYRKTPGHDDKEFMRIMMTFCNNLKDIYTNIIGAECSVSIKVPQYDPSVSTNTILMNLTRDIKHNHRDTVKYSGIKHSLIGNTAFINSFNKVMTNSKERHYINNAVNSTENYDNTSKTCYDNGVLPYNSELVMPIAPILTDNKRNFDCLGFLCVDCVKKGAFISKYNAPILEGVADGIYDLLSERNSFINSLKTAKYDE